MEGEHAGASMQMLDRLAVHFMKLWWRSEGFLERCERFLERWKRAESAGYEDPTEPLPVRRDYHGGYGNTHESGCGWAWVAGIVAIGALIVLALYSVDSAIDRLEAKVSALSAEHTRE
jgi:hypothetical protein